MNLSAIVQGNVDTVTPRVPLTLRISEPPTVDSNYKPVPQYATYSVTGQIQAMQYKDLMQISSLNLNGTRRKIYLYGVVEAVVRALNKGGDLITDPDGNVWLVALVLEQWAKDWCSVAVTLQDGS